MRLLAITGFLGSGKTSLILTLAKVLASRGQRLAVIENEIGDQGVDGQLLHGSGLAVRQLAGGCVCCTLRGDLRSSVEQLIAEHRPDVIVVEPSGVAGPSAVGDALADLPGMPPLEILGIVDPTRFDLLLEINDQFIADLAQVAQVLAITKTDVAKPGLVERVRSALAALAPASPIIALRSDDADAVGDVLDLLATQAPHVHPSDAPATGKPAAVAVARSRILRGPSLDATSIVRQTEAALLALAAGLPDSTQGVPGHLKAFIDAGPAGVACLSVTALDQGCSHRGQTLSGQLDRAVITVNAIVCGMSLRELERLVDGALGWSAPISGSGVLR